jgi:stage III sporulation protein AF
MMDTLRAWVITLVSVSILCIIAEYFAPKGNLSKYVRLVCGLVVMAAIAMPVINIFKGDLRLDNIVFEDYVKLSQGELRKRVEKLQKDDSGQIIEIYRKSLISDISERFKSEGEFKITNVDAVLYENPNSNEFGEIRALYLILEPGKENKQKVLKQETVQRIKSELSAVFSVNKEKIILDARFFNEGG